VSLDLKKKKKSIHHLMRVRQFDFETESRKLSEIRVQISNQKKNLDLLQNQYLLSVDKLNQARFAQNVWEEKLLMSGSEFYKKDWIRTLKKIKDLDFLLNIQIKKVIECQNNLKVSEKLYEKISEEEKKELERKEQNQMDDLGRL
jgi:hypothetical protein